MYQNPYDVAEVSHDQAVRELIWAAGWVSASDRGLIVDSLAWEHAREAKFWEGVVLSRLAGLTPNFQKGQRVIVSAQQTRSDNQLGLTLSGGSQYHIKQVYFYKGSWRLELRETQKGYDALGLFLYPAKDFSLIQETSEEQAVFSA